MIHSGPKVGQVKTYRLDPSFGFKGRAKNMGKLLELVHGKNTRKNPVKAAPASEEKRLEVEGQLKMFDAPEGNKVSRASALLFLKRDSFKNRRD